jgi:glycosyltransferase involved in cell wall biosynthesis
MRTRLVATYSFKGRTALMINSISSNVLAKEYDDQSQELKQYEGKFRLMTLTKYYPHKNLERIVEAFCRYRSDLLDVVVFLTISKKHGSGAKRLIQRIKDEGLTSNLICVGEIAQRDLARWFQYCDAMLFPTLLESFSSTYVEAMHFGLPIITSDIDFAHAVCDNAAIYCDPWCHQSIKNAILELKKNPELRGDLTEKGYSRLREINQSWDSIVSNALQEIEELFCADKQYRHQ